MIGLLASFAVRAALGLTALFAASMGAIHLQPYDDSAVRAFVAPPPDCPAPCFMGIRPGITTTDEGIELLRAHEWVDNVREFTSARGTRTIFWTWSGAQPAFINPERRGFFIAARGVVLDVRVHTRVPLHQMLLIYGGSDRGYLFGGIFGTPQSRFYQLIFEDAHVNLHFDYVRSGWDTCAPDLWNVSAEVSFVARAPRARDGGIFDPCLKTVLFDSL